MLSAIKSNLRSRSRGMTVRHTVVGSPHRARAETFVTDMFQRHYDAELTSFAPNLMLLEKDEGIAAVAGWRCAGTERLFLENYLDVPVETAVSRLAGKPVDRQRIVEVGNLASEARGGSVGVILTLAAHLDRLGFEWVVFTATSELIGMLRRLGLPPLALAAADPERLGADAGAWGSYYATHPVVVAGRIRLALDRASLRG
ncbi:MAG: thermostable hemolysin [Sulfuritalea sp.]|nr:thermostable hemolysin [Sulfuritalea sp.]